MAWCMNGMVALNGACLSSGQLYKQADIPDEDLAQQELGLERTREGFSVERRWLPLPARVPAWP